MPDHITAAELREAGAVSEACDKPTNAGLFRAAAAALDAKDARIAEPHVPPNDRPTVAALLAKHGGGE